MVFYSKRNWTQRKEKVKLVPDFWRIKLTGMQLNGVLQNNNVPRPLPHTVHSNSKSSITGRINDRDFITLARTNKTTLQARFHFAVGLLSNKSQKTSKCGKNISDNFFLFPTHFDVLCDILLNRCTKTWKLFANSVVTEVLSV